MTRADVLVMLASYGDRPVSAVGEGIDSLELAWLLHQAEQRYGALDVSDDDLSTMSTVDAAIAVLRRVLPS